MVIIQDLPIQASAAANSAKDSEGSTPDKCNYLENSKFLKDVLICTTGRSDLKNLIKVKLQISTLDTCLQHLSFYTPNLTELILDDSILLSLRDLGCDLKNLKVLHVCRCKLASLDGIFGLEKLMELHAQNNKIQDLSPCVFLPEIVILDFEKNRLADINMVSFLVMCQNLKHMVLDGNPKLTKTKNYRCLIKEMLPDLVSLDNIGF